MTLISLFNGYFIFQNALSPSQFSFICLIVPLTTYSFNVMIKNFAPLFVLPLSWTSFWSQSNNDSSFDIRTKDINCRYMTNDKTNVTRLSIWWSKWIFGEDWRLDKLKINESIKSFVIYFIVWKDWNYFIITQLIL